MLVLDYCCGCFPLRTGCLVIGYLDLIANIILAIFAILSLNAGISIAYSGKYDEGAITVYAILLIFIIIFLAFTIALLYGLHKEKPGHVKAYLIYGLVLLIICTIPFIVSLIMGAKEPISIVGRIVAIALRAYFLLVIRSHYVRMLGTNYNSSLCKQQQIP